jgi:hypothetical protein
MPRFTLAGARSRAARSNARAAPEELEPDCVFVWKSLADMRALLKWLGELMAAEKDPRSFKHLARARRYLLRVEWILSNGFFPDEVLRN